MSDVNLLMVHGWGMDWTVWQPMAPFIPAKRAETVDLGFTGGGHWPDPPPEPPLVAVGHSLGGLWLLEKWPFGWDALVLINGFPRFTAADAFDQGVAPRVLDRMIDKHRGAPEAVARDFLKRAGCPKPPDQWDRDVMGEGLEWLRDWDARAALAGAGPVLVLAGAQDPIVPPAMTEQAFAGLDTVEVRIHETAGHMLPLEDPEWTGRAVMEMVDRLK